MKQLIVYADMEGASGIFEGNVEALYPAELYEESSLWQDYGRAALTSDVLAVCQGANEAGADEILLYDGHFAGCESFNVLLDRLPDNVRVFDVPNREMHWRRIRGQAAWEPWAIVTVGQHARYGEPDAYFPHTIQSPPIQAFWVNGLHMAEIGTVVTAFRGTPYAANVGCAASHKEARELCASVSCITVKDKAKGWEPTPEETFPLIRSGVRDALLDLAQKEPFLIEGPCQCALEVCEGYKFVPPTHLSWKGSFSPRRAQWEAVSPEIGLELFHAVRSCIVRDEG